MRQSGLWFLSVALVLVSVGCRDRVDPNAEFSIIGEVQDEDGLPVANATVTVYKVDYFDRITWHDTAFLHSPSLADQPGLKDIYTTTSDAAGNFALTRKGRDFNTEGGGRAAFLSVVFVDPDDPEGMRATASDWFFFDDRDPLCDSSDRRGPRCHDVGELTLWKETGISASQSGNDIVISWSGQAAPTGYNVDDGPFRPTFAFAYEEVGTMWWGAYSHGNSATIPRSAFDNNATQPGFFVVGYGREISGLRRYMYRSGWQDGAINGYTTVSYGDYFVDGAASLLDDSLIEVTTDGYFDPATIVPLDGHPTDLYVDLGAERSIDEILVYSLGVEPNLNNATVEIHTHTSTATSPPDFSDAGWTFRAEIDPGDTSENWVYGGWTGAGTGTATWVRISAYPVGSAVQPYFTFVDEVSVLY